MTIHDEFDLGDMEVKRVKEEGEPRCRQCKFKIVEGGNWYDRLAHRRGFCSAGCEEVYDHEMAMIKRAAEEGR